MGQKLSKWKTQTFPRGLNCSLARENSYIAGESPIGRLTLPLLITMMKKNFFYLVYLDGLPVYNSIYGIFSREIENYSQKFIVVNSIQVQKD